MININTVDTGLASIGIINDLGLTPGGMDLTDLYHWMFPVFNGQPKFEDYYYGA